MGQVSIALNGRTYRLNCGDGEEERLAALAAYLKDKFDALARDSGGAVNEQLLLMTALIITDELFDAVGETSTPAVSVTPA
jgi:cell division protein ZapA